MNMRLKNFDYIKKQKLLIVLCCLVYSFAYVGRYGYNANISSIIAWYGITRADAGAVSTFFFFSYGAARPEGFCESAWQNLYPFVMALASGGEGLFDGWMKDPKSALISCNDGFRPVSFLIEALEEK